MYELSDIEREILRRCLLKDTEAGQELREHDREMEERESVPMGDTLRRRFTENAEQFDALMSEMLNENTQLRAERDRLRAALNPRLWSKEMHDAWHKNIPDTQAAFDAIRALAECGE